LGLLEEAADKADDKEVTNEKIPNTIPFTINRVPLAFQALFHLLNSGGETGTAINAIYFALKF
jgi:hypothetical protein